MRSKDNTVDGVVNEVLVVTQTSHDAKEEEEGQMLETEKTTKHVDDEEKTGPNKEDKSAQNDEQMFGLRDLSRDNLLKLLGIMEGEIQVKYLFMICENERLSSVIIPVFVHLCNFYFGTAADIYNVNVLMS